MQKRECVRQVLLLAYWRVNAQLRRFVISILRGHFAIGERTPLRFERRQGQITQKWINKCNKFNSVTKACKLIILFIFVVSKVIIYIAGIMGKTFVIWYLIHRPVNGKYKFWNVEMSRHSRKHYILLYHCVWVWELDCTKATWKENWAVGGEICGHLQGKGCVIMGIKNKRRNN